MNNVPSIRAGVFENEWAAERAVASLLEAGFSKEKISVVSARPFAHSVDQVDQEDVASVAPSGSHTKEGIAIGGTIGSALGGAAALIGVVATGGVGLFVVGPLLAAAAVGGVTGGFVGAMMSRGFEPEIADFYDQALSKGQFLVAVEDVEGGPPLESADEALERAGAKSIPMRKS